MTLPTLSIVVPVLDERDQIEPQFESIRPIEAERIWVDGGSKDGTPEFLEAAGERVLHVRPGRGPQLDAGARAASGNILLFLHVDVRLPPGAGQIVARSVSKGYVAGAFSLAYGPGDPAALEVIAFFANIRTRSTGIPFGDQAIWCTRAAYEATGGFRPLPIMEDVDFAARLRQVGPVDLFEESVEASSRRFRRRGIFPTVLNDWRCQIGWMAGVDIETIARWYR